MKVMRPIKNAERLKNKELPKLNGVKEKERKWKLLYHNHQPRLQWSLYNVQKRNLPILQRLHSHRVVQGIAIEVQSQGAFEKLLRYYFDHQEKRKKWLSP